MHGPNGLSQFRREPGRAGDSWSNAVFKSNHYGKPLYTKAKELNFDAPFVRETVRCLMRFALGNVETGYMALYCDRKMEHGTQYDDEGNLIMPQMDFVVTCLPRSAFHMASEGYACAPTDVGLDWIVSGGGSAELPEVEGLNYMRRMVMGGPMGTSYELHLLSTLPKEMRGKKRKSYYCGEPCECQIYETYVRNVNIGHFGLRASEGKNGEMSGNRSWRSGYSLESEHVGFGINEFLGRAEYSPSKGSPTNEHEVRVRVSWDFEKLKK